MRRPSEWMSTFFDWITGLDSSFANTVYSWKPGLRYRSIFLHERRCQGCRHCNFANISINAMDQNKPKGEVNEKINGHLQERNPCPGPGLISSC